MIEMSLELKKRVITAGVGAAILLSLLILGGWVGAFCFVTVISLGMIFEYTEITYSMGDRVEKRYFLLSLSCLVTLLNWLMPFHDALWVFSLDCQTAYGQYLKHPFQRTRLLDFWWSLPRLYAGLFPSDL